MAELENGTNLDNGGSGTESGAAGTPAQEEKKFTQAELDSILGERLAKQKKHYDEKYSDYDKYKAWKDSQQTETERQAEREKELTKAKNEIAVLRAEKKVAAEQVRPEFIEFVAEKVLKMDGDFDKNLTEYKKANPQFFGEVTVKKVSTTPPMGGNAENKTVNQKMNDLIRGVRK